MLERTHTTRTLAASLLTALLLLAPAAAAQGELAEQVDVLVEHADDEAGQARQDPRGYATNATGPSWQGEQANFTRTWTCETTGAASEDAREQLEEAGACPPVEDAQAGEDQQEAGQGNQAQAQAEELENDTRTAVEDEAAAAEAFVNDTANDPANATSHLSTFLNRTVTFLERLLGIPVSLATFVGGGVVDLLDEAGKISVELASATGSGALALVEGSVDGVRAVLSATGHGLGAVLDATHALATGTADGVAALAATLAQGVEDGSRAVGHAAKATTEAVGDGLKAAVDAVSSFVGSRDAPASGPQAPGDRTGELADGTLDGGLDLPVDIEA